MKIVMIYPSQESEKAISNYSSHLVENIKKKGINIDSITYTAGSPISFLKILSKLKKYDIIHLQHEYNLLGYFGLPFFLFLPSINWVKRKKFLITMHTVFSQKEKFIENPAKNFLRNKLYLLQNKLINLASNLTIVHADFFKDILIKEYGFNKDKVKIIPHGIMEKIKITDQRKAKKELGLKGKIYLIIGNILPVNGTDIILKQANKIGKTILIVTNPKPVNIRNNKKTKNYIGLIKKIVKENNLEKFVRLDLREIPYSLWWKYFSAADLILLPYKGGIGSGIFSDAMAVRKPVIASNIPYFKWIAKDYGCVKIAKIDLDYSKVIKEAMNQKIYKKMKYECRRYLKERGLSVISEKYKMIYNLKK